MAKRTFRPGEQVKVINEHDSMSSKYQVGDRGTVKRITALGEYEVQMDKDGGEIYLNQYVAAQFIASVFD